MPGYDIEGANLRLRNLITGGNIDTAIRLYNNVVAEGADPSLLINPGVASPSSPAPVSAPPSTPAPPSAPSSVGGLTPDQLNTQAIITATLREYSLDTPEMIAWARQSIVNGSTADQMNLELYDPTSTPGKIVNQLYPEIGVRRAAGEAISIKNAVDYHNGAKALFRARGLPPGFFDTDAEISDLAGKGLSLVEMQDRIDNGFTRVATADPTIRQAFADYFGPSGDHALASYFLDPTKAVPALTKLVDAAEIGGTATQFGFGLSASRAGQLADRGVTESAARTGFGQIQQLNPLFNESMSETNDLTATGEGVDAIFNTGAGDLAIRQRQQERRAAFAGGGGAASAVTGQFGLGRA